MRPANESPQNHDPRPLTIVEMAEKLGVSVRTMHRFLAQGCPAELSGKRLLFKMGQVSAFLAEIGWKKRPYVRRGE